MSVSQCSVECSVELVSLYVIRDTCPDLHFVQYIKASIPSTNAQLSQLDLVFYQNLFRFSVLPSPNLKMIYRLDLELKYCRDFEVEVQSIFCEPV